MRLAKSIRQDVRLAKSKWCDLNKLSLNSLVSVLRRHRLSLAGGDLLFVDGRWYVTHSGLLRIAARKHCQGMCVQPVKEFCDSSSARYATLTALRELALRQAAHELEVREIASTSEECQQQQELSGTSPSSPMAKIDQYDLCQCRCFNGYADQARAKNGRLPRC